MGRIYLSFFLLLVSLLFPLVGFTESYSPISTVKGLTIGQGYVRVKLVDMEPAEDCSKTDYYLLDTSVQKDGFSAVLAAKASGQKLSFQLKGCHGDMPKISHIYFCDRAFCS